jgi:hypothetical protein
MLTFTGTLRGCAVLGGGINRKTNQPVPLRSVIQVEAPDERGLIQLHTITVPDHAPFEAKVGELVNVPVRAWAAGTPVNFAYGGAA